MQSCVNALEGILVQGAQVWMWVDGRRNGAAFEVEIMWWGWKNSPAWFSSNTTHYDAWDCISLRDPQSYGNKGRLPHMLCQYRQEGWNCTLASDWILQYTTMLQHCNTHVPNETKYTLILCCVICMQPVYSATACIWPTFWPLRLRSSAQHVSKPSSSDVCVTWEGRFCGSAGHPHSWVNPACDHTKLCKTGASGIWTWSWLGNAQNGLRALQRNRIRLSWQQRLCLCARNGTRIMGGAPWYCNVCVWGKRQHKHGQLDVCCWYSCTSLWVCSMLACTTCLIDSEG